MKRRKLIMETTTLENAVLLAIGFNDFGDGPGTEIWADCINESARRSNVEGKVLSGVVASLKKKGLIHCTGGGRDATIRMTETGIAAFEILKG